MLLLRHNNKFFSRCTAAAGCNHNYINNITKKHIIIIVRIRPPPIIASYASIATLSSKCNAATATATTASTANAEAKNLVETTTITTQRSQKLLQNQPTQNSNIDHDLALNQTAATATTTAITSANKRKKIRFPRNHWHNTDNHRRFFDEIAPKLGVEKPDDWYTVGIEQIIAHGGSGLLRNYYGNSLVRALQSVYPSHAWEPTRFARAPNGFWDDAANRRRFFDKLAEDLGLRTWQDWYQVTTEQVRQRGGNGFMWRYYRDSLVLALRSVYPEHPWRDAHIQKKPNKYWKDPNNRRKFFDEIGVELGIKSLDDWYGVSLEQVIARGGLSVVANYFDNSLPQALKAVYPEHPWKIWRFTRCRIPSRTCKDPDALREYMEALAAEFSVQHLDDWYRVSMDHVRRFGGVSFIQSNGGLPLVLEKLYPKHAWDLKKFSVTYKKSSQRWMLLLIYRLFPDREIMEEYLHPEMKFSNSRQAMELDAYIPSLSLAFEYNGKQHYKDTPMGNIYGANYQSYARLDSEKKEACQRLGVTLISVPYWWDGSIESLAATIRSIRPDIALQLLDESTGATPIPQSPPAETIKT